MSSPSSEPRCRACDGPVRKAFEAQVLWRHQVSYYRCLECDSLQPETPYWLEEAYEAAIVATDSGAVDRNLVSHAAVVAIAEILNIRGRVVDFGGGAGLLCRLLRDSGYDAYVYDKYADPVFARAFSVDFSKIPLNEISLLTAVEVLEHCAQPAADVGALLEKRPQVLVATTVPYRGEGVDWWYLGLPTGQHVFFYSQKALALLAERYGYHYQGFGIFHVLTQAPISGWQRLRLRVWLSRMGLRTMRIRLAAAQRGQHSAADFDRLCKELETRQRQRDERS
jgi:methyltransferase family protein